MQIIEPNQSISLNRHLSRRLKRTVRFLPQTSRAMTMTIQAGRGAGKSRLLGRVLVWQDILKGLPVVLFDPTGGSINNVLDKLLRYLKEKGIAATGLEKRLLYLDASGQSGYTFSFPILYRLGNESLYSLAQRFSDAVIINDPHLATASIEGANRIRKLSTYVNMILYALGAQITEAHSLLYEPEKWKPLFGRAIRAYPEVKEAIILFEQEYMSLPDRERKSRLDAYLGKTLLFNLDPAAKAMFGSSAQFSWEEVVQERKIVLLDFSKELDVQKRQFKMFWLFHSLIEYVKHRGIGKSLAPIAIYIDELSAMLNLDTASGGSAFATYLDEIVNIYSRNANIFLTFAFQEWWQLPERLQKTLLTSGSLLLGASSDLDSAKKLAAMLFAYNPLLIKKVDPILMQSVGEVFEAGHRTSEYSIDEQILLNAYKFLRLPRFHFMSRIAENEGSFFAPLQEISIEHMDQDQWVQEEKVAQAKQLLAKHTGQPIAELLAQIEERRVKLFAPTENHKPAKIKIHGAPHPVSSLSPAPEANPVQETETDSDDSIY